MSKVAKKIGRALGKVVDGAKKVVKKVTKSKLFKVVATAAAIYFTGGAVLGAMGGASAASAAGSSVLAGAAKGAVAGLGSAGAGISNAWSSLIGGNVAGVGTALKAGVTGANTAGASAISGGVTSALGTGYNATTGLLKPPIATGPTAGSFTPMTGTASSPSPAVFNGSSVTSSLPGAANTTAATGSVTGNALSSMPIDKLLEMPMSELQRQAGSLSAGQVSALKQAGIELSAKPGLLRTMFSSPLALPMAMQIGGNAITGKAESELAQERDDFDRERYNRNMGTRLFTSNN